MATYKEIQTWVKQNYGFVPETCWIADVKFQSGLPMRKAPNRKGAGMHWAEGHVNPMLGLRNILCSDRWQEDWPKIEARLRHQASQQRRTLHQAHHPQPPTSLIARALHGDFGDLVSEQPAPAPKPPRRNPWRNFKHGKALFQRSLPPKF